MVENITDSVGLILILIFWLLWTFFSDTRYNHGILIAFLLPLAPFLMVIMLVIFYMVKLVLYPVFSILGRKKEYEALIEKIKIETGLFLLL